MATFPFGGAGARGPFTLGALLLSVLCASPSARGQSSPEATPEATPLEVDGVWKRVPTDAAPTPRYFQLETKDDGRVEGRLLNPPVEGMEARLDLERTGDRLEGKTIWTEGPHQAETAWEFQLQGPDTLTGRSEWIDWEGGTVYDRGWDPHSLVRVPREGLVTQGKAEAPFGDEIEDLAALEGGWRGVGGPWVATQVNGRLVLRPVGHHEGVEVVLEDDRGTLRGVATLPNQTSSKVELALNAEERALVGRSSWSVSAPELGEESPTGWSPLRFERLERREADETGVTTAAEVEAGLEGPILGVFKRGDDLFLRVQEEGGETVGLLTDREGAEQARVRFEPRSGVWVGTVNWGGFETTWELARTEEGLRGRCQWVDLHEGQVVARGWRPCELKRLRRIF